LRIFIADLASPEWRYKTASPDLPVRCWGSRFWTTWASG
jgi:hypothetical protein